MQRHASRALWLGVLLPLFPSCKPPEKPPAAPAAEISPLAPQLAAARIDSAKDKLDRSRPDEALALLVSALAADPGSAEALSLAESILAETVWNLPQLTLRHGLPVTHLIHAAPSSLWVGLGGDIHTTVRWNLETLRLESVLFPVGKVETRSLVMGPDNRSLVIARGPANLLCDAATLKPIRDLGPPPDFLTPASTLVFSPDGLLIAHPVHVSEKDRSIVWHLRDAASGQILRTSDPTAADRPQPLAAWLDRTRLKVLHADGSLLELPVNPVEPALSTPLAKPVKLLHAHFSTDGNSVLTLQDAGPHQPPELSVISYAETDDGTLKPEHLAAAHPWSIGPNLWNGLMKNPDHAPFGISENRLQIFAPPHAPVLTEGGITSAAFGPDSVITGDAGGIVSLHRLLPLPVRKDAGTAGVSGFPQLAAALAGCRYDEATRDFVRLTPAERAVALEGIDPATVFPKLDFTNVIAAFKSAAPREPAADALQLLPERLLRSRPAGEPELREIGTAFRGGETEAVLTAIRGTGGKGPAAAAALAFSLDSEKPEWIEACLSTSVDLPPLLRRLALSRVAWLQGRKAEALANWPEVFPVLTDVRLREDWDGWEQVDFQPALDRLRECVSGELAAIAVPENATAEQRRAVADRLNDPATVIAVGRARFADACLRAALAFSSHQEETETTFQLATLARNMGAAPEPCLRAEALALTGQGDYQNALPRWLRLITEHPVETHLPGDYAEAAYTAFENLDPGQAMRILTTGMHRFPQDANFALRAGWVALLTGNSERAYRFLREGQRIGYPEEKLENATALLTIAAAQSGADDDAAVYFQNLLEIDPAWSDPTTLDSLDWPEELEATLRVFCEP
jgi:tetratricopeptide (TPR) repeat protein